MRATAFLLLGILFLFGCSSVREDPTDSFAPRPENAGSNSYQIVRISKYNHPYGFEKELLLSKLAHFRKEFATIKKRSDFTDGYYGDLDFKEYMKIAQSFLDSDLDGAEKYLKSLPDSIKFRSADFDDSKYDIGDIKWTDKSRKLHLVDFYGQYYTSDWSAYAFIINLIPTAKDGYGKLEFTVNGESLAFRRKMRKKIWSPSTYFWVHTDLLVTEDGGDKPPMLLLINDPNDSGDMSGIYLVMPRSGK